MSGNKYPRDIGRSSQLSNERVVIQFGDTFCFNTSDEFVGLSENTCALVVDNLNPTLSTCLFDGEKKIPPFIKRFEDEKDDTGDWIYKYWAFSGIVESSYHRDTGVIKGWIWFQKWAIEKDTGKDFYQWTGIAEVEYVDNGSAPTILTHRKDLPPNRRPLFNDWEPGFGSFCAVSDGLYVVGLPFH